MKYMHRAHMAGIVFFALVFMHILLLSYTSESAVIYAATACTKKALGDADCNDVIDMADFEIFRKEYTGVLTTKTADFDNSGVVGVSDFETWRKAFFSGTGGTPSPITSVPPLTVTNGPIPTPGKVTQGMWINSAELAKLPMSGTAWTNLKSAADGSLGSPQVSNQDSNHDVLTMAAALVYARTGQAAYRTKAVNAIMSAIGTEQGGRVLAEARNMLGYVVAADLVDLKSYDAAKDSQFRAWITKVRTEQMTECDTLIKCNENRPNNWGTHAGSSRIAIDIYLGDKADLDKAANVLKGWLGDRTAYAGFTYGDLSWQCDASKPVGVNPACMKGGQNIDGALPDDMRRGGAFKWPPGPTDYPWGGLEGALASAELLSRQGYDSYNWSNQAIRRAVGFLYRVGGSFLPSGDDVWMPWVVNHAYGSNEFKTTSPVTAGKNMGWTDWTHVGR